MTDESTIVEAVGISANSEVPGLAEAMEAAMSKAVMECYAEHITDPDVMRERMLAAQEAVVAGWGVSAETDG